MPILCVSLHTMLQKKKKKKKRLKKGNKKKDNHKTKYYKTNKLSVLKNKITELHFSLYLKLSQTQGTEKIMNYYYSLGEWQKGFKFYWARTSQFLKSHAVQSFPDMIPASEEIEFQKWRKREVTLRKVVPLKMIKTVLLSRVSLLPPTPSHILFFLDSSPI